MAVKRSRCETAQRQCRGGHTTHATERMLANRASCAAGCLRAWSTAAPAAAAGTACRGAGIWRAPKPLQGTCRDPRSQAVPSVISGSPHRSPQRPEFSSIASGGPRGASGAADRRQVERGMTSALPVRAQVPAAGSDGLRQHASWSPCVSCRCDHDAQYISAASAAYKPSPPLLGPCPSPAALLRACQRPRGAPHPDPCPLRAADTMTTAARWWRWRATTTASLPPPPACPPATPSSRVTRPRSCDCERQRGTGQRLPCSRRCILVRELAAVAAHAAAVRLNTCALPAALLTAAALPPLFLIHSNPKCVVASAGMQVSRSQQHAAQLCAHRDRSAPSGLCGL